MSKKQPDWSWFWQGTLKNPLGRLKWRLATRYWAQTCKKLLRGLKIKTYLELGAGSGFLAKILGEEFGFSVTLVDNNPLAKKAWQKFAGMGEYLVADFFQFKPKKKFDLVFSHGVIDHFFDLKERIKAIEVHRRLSGKYVAVLVPKKSFWIEHFCHLSEEKGYEKLYSFTELEKEMRKAGLKPFKRAQDFHILGVLASV